LYKKDEESIMAHNDISTDIENKQTTNNVAKENSKTLQQQLNDANKEIEELTLQLAWLERPYE